MDDTVPQKTGNNVVIWFLIAGVIVGVAFGIRWFIKARNTASISSCVNGLRQIDGAKDQWAIEHHRGTSDVVTSNEVIQYISGGMIPVCPQGGTYSLNLVGENPTCSIGGPEHSLPLSVIVSNAPVNGTNTIP